MSSKIIRLAVSNMLRIEAAEVKPDGAVIIVAGDNDQGKTSLLNCIGIALAGKGKTPQPIRQGQTRGEIILETETLIVTRTFRAAGGGNLEVRDKEKGVLTSPQGKLDTLFRLTTFDPLTFTREEPKKQAAILRDLAGLDTSDLDNEHGKLFAERTEVGRRRDDQKGRVNGIQRDTDAPAEPVSVADLTRQLQEANTANNENDAKRESLADHLDAVASCEQATDDAAVAVTAAENALAKAKETFAEKKRILMDARSEAEEVKKAVEALADIDTAPILAQIEGAEAINTKVRANKEWETEHQRLVSLEGEYQKLTERLEGIRGTRESRIAKAKYPVDGLGFTEDGVTFEGVPFQQCSSSKQIRVSLAIACALNPELRVMLIRDGSLLDAKSLELVREFAEKHEAQVFMECVGQREDATVTIEAGNVIENPVKKPAKKGK
jgi:DNA repair exonuclease SbcCD ATPase subunit